MLLLWSACRPVVTTDDGPTDRAHSSAPATADTAAGTPTADTGAPTGTADTGASAPSFSAGPARPWGFTEWARHQHHAQVAFSARGQWLNVAFSEGDYLDHNTSWWTRVDLDGAPLGPPTAIGGGLELLKPALAVDPSDRLVMAFQGVDESVWFERYTPSTGSSELVQLQPPVADSANHSPDLVLADDGDATVVWYTRPGLASPSGWYRTQIVGTDFAGEGDGFGPVPDVTPAAPDLDRTPDGRSLLAWMDYSPSGTAVQLSWLDASGGATSQVEVWSGPALVSRPQLDVAEDGAIALTFPATAGPGDHEIVVLVLEADGTERFRVNPFDVPEVPGLSTVLALSPATLLLAWSAGEDLPGGVYVALLSAHDGALLLPPLQIAAEPSAARPSLAATAVGPGRWRVGMSWEQEDAAGVREVWGTVASVIAP